MSNIVPVVALGGTCSPEGVSQNMATAAWIALSQPEPGGDSAPAAMEHVPHVGTLFLDSSAGGQVIANVVTQEQLRLEGTGWSLFPGEDGFSVAVRTKPADVDGHGEQAERMGLLDVMNKVLSVAPSGELFVTQKGTYDIESWTVAQSKFKTCHFTMKPSNPGGVVVFMLYAFHIPRAAGQRLFWDMASIFSGLFPNMYGGIPSQWINKRRDAWHEASRLILKGKHMCDSAGSHGEEEFTQKCLPHLSITTPLLVLLLWRWSSNVESAGGVVSA